MNSLPSMNKRSYLCYFQLLTALGFPFPMILAHSIKILIAMEKKVKFLRMTKKGKHVQSNHQKKIKSEVVFDVKASPNQIDFKSSLATPILLIFFSVRYPLDCYPR